MSSAPEEQAAAGGSSPPNPNLVATTIERLRAEQEASVSTQAQAVLLHEIAVLERGAGDDGGAARDLLSAINLEPSFREPLERLLAIVIRRQSFKNLTKLLERLQRLSSRSDDIERAILDLAQHLAHSEDDARRGLEVLEEGLDANPESAPLWYAYEVLAGKLVEPAAYEKALTERAARARHGTYRALLYLDLARVKADSGDADGSLASLQLAIDQAGPATYAANQAKARLARELERSDELADALSTHATLLEQAHSDATLKATLGVPSWECSVPRLVDALLCAGEAHRKLGNVSQATKLIDKGLELIPDEPRLSHARLNLAEQAGDTQTAARLAKAELDHGCKGPRAAALWLRVAEAAAAEGDGAQALDAVGRALLEEASSVPARALELDLLSSGAEPIRLAQALERAADQLPTEEGKARYYIAAADAWARLAKDSQGARAALSQAGMFGASPALVGRLGRMLASQSDDPQWYEEATRRLIAAGSSPDEHADLWFEIARRRLLTGNLEGTDQALGELSKLPKGAWLANALGAFGLPLAAPAPSSAPPESESGESLREDAAAQRAARSLDAVSKLAELEGDAEVARALRWVLIHRSRRAGDQAGSLVQLRRLQESNPADLATAIALAAELRNSERPLDAAEVLQACGTYVEDPETGVVLLIDAGLTAWQDGDRRRAVECFSQAHELEPAVGGPMLRWALRAVEPNEMEARRRALDSGITDGPVELLERFGLEISRGGDVDAARVAVENIPESAPSGLRSAALLAKSLWSRDKDIHAQLDAAVTLQSRPGISQAVAHGAEHLLEIERARSEGTFDATRAEATAGGWASKDPSALAALEWLGAAVGAADFAREIEARRAVAQRLDPVLGTAIEASASIIHLLSSDTEQQPLASSEPVALLTNLELAAPGCDPRRRIEALRSAAGLLGDDSVSLSRAMIGYNELALGNLVGAIESFRSVIEAFPGDVIGWEGLRAAALAQGDRALLAEASAALGDACSDDADGAKYWEQAALILIDELNDQERGEFALARAVARDVRRGVAFDKLFRIVRGKADDSRLLELISQRLEVAEDAVELAKLYWERARVLRKAGNHTAALDALENVTMLEADHVGALALTGEIYLSTKQFPQAASSLARLAALDLAPAKQRLMSGMAAVDIFEKKLGDVSGALKVLLVLHRAELSNLPVRERLARAAAQERDWATATEVLEQLMQERESSEGRAEVARLAMVIHRDQLQQPAAAKNAMAALLREIPADGEALELLLDDVVTGPQAQQLLERAKQDLIATLQHDTLDPDPIDRLAKVADKLQDAPLRQAAVGALTAVGEGSPALDQELNLLDQRVAHVPQMAIDEQGLPELLDAEDRGPMGELMRLLAPVLAQAIGPVIETFGATKKHKVSARAGLPIRNEIAAWAGALGVGDFDLYVGGTEHDAVNAVATETPALVVGEGVTAPLSAQHRQAVARELFALRRGTTILRHRDPTDIAALVVACGRILGVALESPNYAMLGDFERLIGKAMPRRLKKPLTSALTSIADEGQDPVSWYHAATASLDRMAAVAAGDVSWVLAGSAQGRGRLGASIEAQNRAQRILSFVLSPAYLTLRNRLGMGVR